MSSQNSVVSVPHLIIGSGIAGLMLALKLARNSKVMLIAKGSLVDSNTWFAQGGIASVLDEADSFEDHIRDTLIAGAGLCHEKIVRMVVESGPAAIGELIELGVRFTPAVEKDLNGSYPYHLTQEGGHSQRRVIHAHDITGKEVVSTLIRCVTTHPNIKVVERQMAIDLITSDKYAPNFSKNSCLGAYVMDRKTREIYQVRSQRTYLCTGGHGKVYLYTSNPDSATGDGVAMGWRAGCKVANLEFMQFHPTCLYHPEAKNFLISEAVRGEGGILKDHDGHAFMADYHAQGSLAPRDVVARAIDTELKRSGRSHAFLDVRHLGAEKIKTHFPNIYKVCLEFGIAMQEQMIPVVPAAHYSCGGLVVDEFGCTGVENLFALGEVACTGLHGANRLASNSLLEALVFANRVAAAAADAVGPADHVEVPPWNEGRAAAPDELVVLYHTWDEIRRLMWNYVGIVRSEKRLKRAFDRITALKRELDEYYWDYKLTDDLLEVRNLAQVASLTIRCAMSRKESRGIHYNIDYPSIAQTVTAKDTVLW